MITTSNSLSRKKDKRYSELKSGFNYVLQSSPLRLFAIILHSLMCRDLIVVIKEAFVIVQKGQCCEADH